MYFLQKREAVRRLSQGSGAPGYPRDHRSALSLQAPGQPLQRRKFPGRDIFYFIHTHKCM